MGDIPEPAQRGRPYRQRHCDVRIAVWCRSLSLVAGTIRFGKRHVEQAGRAVVPLTADGLTTPRTKHGSVRNDVKATPAHSIERRFVLCCLLNASAWIFESREMIHVLDAFVVIEDDLSSGRDDDGVATDLLGHEIPELV